MREFPEEMWSGDNFRIADQREVISSNHRKMLVFIEDLRG
jgi:hypothetical protein